jgi:hypothetical protein
MNQVVKKEEGALAINMFEADADKGSQNMTQEDFALPFLKVLGQLSPEVNKVHARYVEGAEPGMIINSVTNQLYDGAKGIDVLPVFYERKLIEWQDRGAGTGAPVAIHDASSDIMSQTTRDKSYKDRLPNGNYIDNTANHYVVVLGDSPQTALVSMKSTQLKISRKWNSIMMGIKLQGKTEVSKVGPVEDQGVYGIAKSFAEQVGKDDVEVKHGSDESKTDSPY